MDKSYQFRIYPNSAQSELIKKTFGCSRYVYNYYLAQRIEQYNASGKSPSLYDQDKDLTSLKLSTPWLQEVDSRALKSELRFLDKAYKNFFRRRKKGTRCSYPRFKRKKEYEMKYTTNNVGQNIKVVDGKIQLPKLGYVKCRVSKKISGRIVNVTVTLRSSGKYYVSVYCVSEDKTQLPKTGAVIGIDVGLKSLAVTSDGVSIPNPKFRPKLQKKIARFNRQLSRKTRDSNNWEKQRVKLARLHEHIANQRRDNLQKLTTDLIRKYDVLCVEKLNVHGLEKNHCIAGSIADANFSEFRRELEYKAAWYGKTVSEVDMFFPSTRKCSCCGTTLSHAIPLSVREWDCPFCGASHDRDVNAAINILNEGLRLLA